MKMSRVKSIAIGMLVVLGVNFAIDLFIPQPFSLIITSIVVVLVLDWLWNRSKNMEYAQNGSETYDRQQKSET